MRSRMLGRVSSVRPTGGFVRLRPGWCGPSRPKLTARKLSFPGKPKLRKPANLPPTLPGGPGRSCALPSRAGAWARGTLTFLTFVRFRTVGRLTRGPG
jgi:hypothetical protein